ncbi:endoplasmic reticulum-based factor for assembly of V-ATPase-domain-containing protein [Aspergillus coremiiformis]|uniref:Endoplasmic reticulum-based factor for assembly of V-ATPase-domain-containing protein n=1 Tax=Aspergillus coremiiformis TaxID=138285 RepID=A0A5N6ZI15_9EURO|nr:endoplasmic reticulum-based factor for assembly of V-ATPase-domain-containing protein [Aspergillus coremiiformis]
MVQLTTTPRILSALATIPPPDRKTLNLPDPTPEHPIITHDQLIRLSHYIRNTKARPNPKQTLNALLHGTTLYIPPPPKKPPPSPEYLALKARLLAAYEKDAYIQMTTTSSSTQTIHRPEPIFSSSTPTVSAVHEGAEQDVDTLTPSLVLNIFLSVVITGFSVYGALRSFATGGISEAARVLVSFGAAVGVAVAEVAIYAIYLGKVDRARKKERGIRERKVVVGTEALGVDASRRVRGETEEIWGRGPNGGLRRRVRERWEEKEMVD